MKPNAPNQPNVPDVLDSIEALYGPCPEARSQAPLPEPPPARKTRSEKGREIFEANKVIRPIGIYARKIRERFNGGQYSLLVEASEPGKFYQVSCSICDCPDFIRRYYFKSDSTPCKHMEAVKIALETWEQEEKEKEMENFLSVIPPGHGDGPRTWETKAEAVERQREEWRMENVGRNEIVYFCDGGREVLREMVEHC